MMEMAEMTVKLECETVENSRPAREQRLEETSKENAREQLEWRILEEQQAI